MVLKEEEPSDSLSDSSVLADPKGFEPLTFWSVAPSLPQTASDFIQYNQLSFNIQAQNWLKCPRAHALQIFLILKCTRSAHV